MNFARASPGSARPLNPRTSSTGWPRRDCGHRKTLKRRPVSAVSTCLDRGDPLTYLPSRVLGVLSCEPKSHGDLAIAGQCLVAGPCHDVESIHINKGPILFGRVPPEPFVEQCSLH